MDADEMFFCKICKKCYALAQDLKKHQNTHHSNNPTFSNNSKEIPQQFRNNNSISITRVQREPSANVQSAIMQNQNSYRRIASAQVGSQAAVSNRRNEMGMKKIVEVVRAKPPVPIRSPDMRMKNPNSAIKSAVGVDVDDDTWQKWEPAHRERDNGVTNADGTIITPSAAERATSAFCNSSPGNPRVVGKQPARKGVPQLLRMPPTNGKRPAPGMSSSTQRANPIGVGGVRGAANPSPVANIMQNLGKIKSLNAQATRPSPKMISVPAPAIVAKKSAPQPPKKAQPPVQPFRVSKPPQVSKNKQKIVPRNAFNNALPKPGAQKAPRLQMDEDEDEDELMEEEDDEDEPPRLQVQPKNPPQAKVSPAAPSPKANVGVTGGKVPPQKLLSTNRFNPIKNTKTNPAEVTARNGNSSNAKSAAASKQKEPPTVTKKSAPGRKGYPNQEAILKRMKACIPTMAGTDYEMPTLSATGSYTNRNGDQVWVCLVCNELESEESSRDMICCDKCEDWYHWECVGVVSSPAANDPWFCKRCIYQVSNDPKKDFPKLFK